MTIENRLKEERKRLGFNQAEFSGLAGRTKKTMIDYEKGISSPDARFLSAIASAGADVQYILTGVRMLLGVDVDRLTLAIETVEEGLEKTKRTMKPDKKAELVIAVYDLFEEPTPVAKQSVLRLVQSAA